MFLKKIKSEHKKTIKYIYFYGRWQIEVFNYN